MYKVLSTFILAASIFLFNYFPSLAGGAVFTNQFTQVAPVESRAVIIFDGKKEILLDSLTFNVNPISQDNFVWVIPVPSKPEVEPIKDELFVKFEKLAEKKINKDILWQRFLYFDVVEERALPSQVFTRPTDIWKFEIIEPGNFDKLNAAVREMGYFIPKRGRPDLKEYIEKRWYFIVAHVNALHIQMDASDSLTTTGAHTLPLKITFDTDIPFYPLKLVSIPPDSDSEYAGLSYEFGSSSEAVLGDKDERIDELLSGPSKNKFPALPLDYMNMKIDLFVLSDRKVTADGFSPAYANWVNTKDINFKDLKGNQYVEVKEKSLYLTRLFTYTPLSQVEDVNLKSARDNASVNSYSNPFLQAVKLLAMIFCIYILIQFAKATLLSFYGKIKIFH